MATTLGEVTEILYAAGEEVPGWHGTHDDLISLADKAFSDKPFCPATRWIFAEWQLTEVEQWNLPSIRPIHHLLSTQMKLSVTVPIDAPLGIGYAPISGFRMTTCACLKAKVPSTYC